MLFFIYTLCLSPLLSAPISRADARAPHSPGTGLEVARDRMAAEPTSPDVARIVMHLTLAQFDWFAEDVPIRVWKPVMNAVKLPQARTMHPEEWFDLQNGDA